MENLRKVLIGKFWSKIEKTEKAWSKNVVKIGNFDGKKFYRI